MNILHITAHLGDGAGKAIAGLSLLGSGMYAKHRILLLQEPKKTNYVDRCKASGVEVLYTVDAEQAISEADVIVMSWWGASAMQLFLAHFPAVPCRVILWMHKNGLYDPILQKKMTDRFDAVLATSPLTLTRWPEAKLVYGYGNFDPKAMEPKKCYDRSDHTFLIGYTGSPSYKKMPDNAVDYFQAVLELVPETRFVLVGESDAVFERDCQMAGLSKYIQFKGWVSDVVPLLPRFDAFGYLLRPDTFATTENAVLEAMACALPVAMPREPIGKYVLGEGNGVLFDSPKTYAEGMAALAVGKALRQELGQAARRHVIKTCDAKENVRRFHAACAEVMKRPKHYFSGEPDNAF